MLPDHDVYLTDWHNARDVPLAAGRFGFDDYVAHVIRFLEAMGPEAHVVAVCQPCVAVLAAVSVMAQGRHRAQPRSMTLMAGPIDARVNPTRVNELATSHSIGWFERHLIATVPLRYRGAMRRVYPGFLQLAAFMSMNLDRHVKAHVDLHGYLASGDHDKAQATRAFYDEYCAVTDLPAEFYLETVERVFQQHLLPLGRLEWRGGRVEPRGDPAHGALHRRGREGRHLRRGADRGGPGPLQRVSGRTCGAITSRRAPATTASSTGPAGGARSTRSSGASSRPAA